jgi:amino acid transporter
MGPFASFAVAFSMVSITTAIFFLLPSLFGTSGAVGVWLWIPCAAGVFLIVLVYAHLAARIPITGFAYQWNSRLINPHYGWFTGYTALLAFMAGTAATAVADVIAEIARILISGNISVWRLQPVQTSLESWFLQVTSRLGEGR